MLRIFSIFFFRSSLRNAKKSLKDTKAKIVSWETNISVYLTHSRDFIESEISRRVGLIARGAGVRVGDETIMYCSPEIAWKKI